MMNAFPADAFFAILSSLGISRDCMSNDNQFRPIMSKDYGFAPNSRKKSRLRRGASKLSHRSLEKECPTGFYWCTQKSCCVPRHLHKPLTCPDGFLWKECRCEQHCVLVYNGDDLGRGNGHDETVGTSVRSNSMSERVQLVNRKRRD